MTRPILITGGTGKTGRRLAERLHRAGVSHRVASRRGGPLGTAPFDWTDATTWDEVLDGVSAVYLVAPPSAGDPAPVMIDFVARALGLGVTRFVLLSAASLPVGGPAMGQVHAWLGDNTDEWAVLRPSWFMQNFSEGAHRISIYESDSIFSATGDGRVPFVSADDIATAAFALFTADTLPNADFVLTGDAALSYDEVAKLIGASVGRRITHHRLTPEQLAELWISRGLSPTHAKLLARMDTAIAAGGAERPTDAVARLTGRRPISFADFVSDNRDIWERTWLGS